MWIHCSRHSFNVFSISARLPTLPRPDLVLVTEWMNVLQKRNTKIISKITNTGIIQDPCKLYDVDSILLPNFSLIIIFFTQTQQGYGHFAPRLDQSKSDRFFFYLAWQWMKERGIIFICIGANWLGAARSDPTVERSDRIPTKTKHIPLNVTKL